MEIFIDKRRGFTLIEILVVIGIISVLAGLAIPAMLRAKINANELAAITALRAISSGCQCYYGDVLPHTYPPDLPTLSTVIPGYIDSALGNAVDDEHSKQGYYFDYSLISREEFAVIAWPSLFGRTGSRNFFVNELGNITYTSENGQAPDQNSPGVE